MGILALAYKPTANSETAPPTITLTRVEVTNSTLHKLGPKIVDAFERVGLSVEWVIEPIKRGLHDAATGKVDGIAVRHPVAVRDYPTLQPIPVPLTKLHYWVYMLTTSDCGQLADLPQKQPVGVHGFAYSTRVYAHSQVGHQQGSSFPQALSMLQAGRADYIVSTDLVYPWMSKFTTVH